MQKAIAQLTSKYQATVPKSVREALKLKARDQIVYEILDDNTVIIRKGYPLDIEYLNALTSTLSEWSSDEDEKSYRNFSFT